MLTALLMVGCNAVDTTGTLSIVTQPSSVTVDAGSTVTLNVVATGSGSLSYQWQLNGSNLPFATSASLVIAGAQAAQSGSYTVIVSSAQGSVTSQPAVVTVGTSTAAPTITVQPISASVAFGSNASFNVVASGGGTLTYQWYLNGVPITGATSAALFLTAVSTASAGSYNVIVSSATGSVTSQAAILVVTGATSANGAAGIESTSAGATSNATGSVVGPTIVSQPADVAVAAGRAVSLSVSATGTGTVSYQWFKDGSPIAGAVSASVVLLPGSSGSYSVLVADELGQVSSSPASLTVSSP